MGLFWLESFENDKFAEKINANGSFVSTTGAPTRVSSSPRTGSYTLDATSAYAVRMGSADQDDLLIVGFALKAVASPPAARTQLVVFRADAEATTHLTLAWETNGTLKLYRGTVAGTLLATSAVVFPVVGTYYHVQMKARLHDSAGTVDVRVDDASVISITGADTKNGGTATVFDTFMVNGSVSGTLTCDDIYACNEQGATNTDFLGPLHIGAQFPNGNGATSNGVGSDGNSTDNYLLDYDGAVVATADYVDLAATGDKDTYAHTDSAFPTANAVAGVFVWGYAQKTDAGARSLIPVARLAGTETDGAALALDNGTYKLHGDVFQTKPGGGAWTVTDVNSSEFGEKAGA